MRALPLFLSLALAVPAAAQAPRPNAAPPAAHDHDHSDPNHKHEDEGPEIDPKDETTVDYLWRKSDVAFHAGDYERAVGLHKAIVVLAPDEIESYSVGSWLLWSLGKGEEALAFLDRGLTANPKDPEMWDAAAQHYDLQKKFAESQKAYGKAIELAGKDAPELMRRRFAHASEKAGDLNSSLAAWQGLVKDYPNDAVNKNNLARIEKTIKEKPGTPVAAAAIVGMVGLLAMAGGRRKAV